VPNIINGKEKEGCKVCKESQGWRKIKAMSPVIVRNAALVIVSGLLIRYRFALLGPKQAKI